MCNVIRLASSLAPQDHPSSEDATGTRHRSDVAAAADDPDAAAKRIAAQWTSDPGAAGSEQPAEDSPARDTCADGSVAPCTDVLGNEARDAAGGILGRVAQSVGSMLGGSKDKAAAQGDAASRKELQDVTQRYKDASSLAATRQRELDAADKAITSARAKLDMVRGLHGCFLRFATTGGGVHHA